MKDFTAIRNRPEEVPFKKGDVLVLFGELFNRGYANGLVEEAEAHGLTVVRATVGRRDENNNLRALTEEESKNIPQPFINVPLEAGFDLEPDSKGQTPNDYLKGLKLSDWQNTQLTEQSLQESLEKGRARFKKQTATFVAQLENLILPKLQAGNHVHFAHLMAGGVPRTKIVLPLMNRVFKGTGDRYLSSKEFWESQIGRFLQLNFHVVTAETFDVLVDESSALREKLKAKNVSTSYVAYGYHGTEVIINGEYHWQSYAPYIQGWAKCDLEKYSKKWFDKGVQTCVYNCPEILTNSSSIFQGVEIALYNLLRSLKREQPTHPITKKMEQDCEQVLKEPQMLQQIFSKVDEFMTWSEKHGTSDYATWPQHSTKEQLEKMLNLSDEILSMHKDEKQLMSAVLSEIIFKSCGYIMLHDAYKPKHAVAWIGHDAVSKCLPKT
ncbi:enoyl-acyl carrier protein reductase FabMG [Pseudobdellovibrio sp. HCB154]|uniref:enoyl ACP reductase FabMG family protein n=1 Tax=Pseudobdellovibrio sp. HCB154 TaxID=3386277 RepID=UPI003917593E